MTSSARTDDEPGPVKFSRLPKRGNLLGLSGPRLTVVAIAAIMFVAALYLGGNAIILATPAILACAALTWVRIAGRAVVEWLPLAARWGHRAASGQLEFRARVATPRPAGTLALPGDAASLQQWVDPDSEAAYVHDPHTATLAAVLEVTHPAFLLLDPEDRQRRTTGWARVLATACRSGRIATLQVLERTLPESGKDLTDWWTHNGHHDDTWSATTYEQLIDRAAPAAEKHATTISLALDLHACGRAIRAAGGGRHGALAVLRQELETLIAALRAADLAPSTPIRPGDLALILRSAYDPVVAAALERHGALGRDLATAGPVAVTETWGALRSDSAHHAVLWISEWPRTLVHPDFLHPLVLAPGVRHTLSLLYTPVRADHAARDIRKKKTEHLADAAQRQRIGQIDDAAQDAEYADVLQQEADVTAGHGILRVTGLLTVTAPDPDELERAVASTEQAAIQANCETRRLWGQQAQAFTAAALPLCRRVR